MPGLRPPRLDGQAWPVDEELRHGVVRRAQEIFEGAGCPSDFCLQLATDEVLVFGGTNRLKWDAVAGFYPDRSYCTEKFLTAFDWVDGKDAE